ncbi:transposase [Nitrosomonas ureae]|uniref:Transposase n=1 Tax=Nitrosomonas ureae TaxID=44577 RepID=A0A2T5IS79_9PROT|nr:transposase [Nitrosomonas ureae]
MHSVRYWIREYQADNADQALRSNGKPTPEQEEIRQLKAQIKQLKLEREILKEATGDSTGHSNTAEIFCEGDKKFNVFLGRSFNSSAIMSSCSCE